MSEFAAELPSKEDFEKAVDSQFEATTSEGAPFAMRLTGLRSHVDNDIQENFSLDFCSPDSAAAAVQDTFTLKHRVLGEIVLFLVPTSRDEKGLHFEAVFNRLKSNV